DSDVQLAWDYGKHKINSAYSQDPAGAIPAASTRQRDVLDDKARAGSSPNPWPSVEGEPGEAAGAGEGAVDRERGERAGVEVAGEEPYGQVGADERGEGAGWPRGGRE